MIDTILFDLDGTLLPMDQEEFIKLYFKGLYLKFGQTYDFEILQKVIWEGTEKMMTNDGRDTNENVFWENFESRLGIKKTDVEKDFTDFYNNEFSIAKGATKARPEIIAYVHTLKQKGYTVVAATNPLFPKVATMNRLRWAGFDPEDFALFTTYEHYHYCKPNPAYYTEVLASLGKQPQNCIMAGNDNLEDMAAEQLGIKGYLITDCLINRANAPLASFWHGTWDGMVQITDFNR